MAVHGRRGPFQSACGACWEHAVRADALFAAEWGLPAELVHEPDLVDAVAVDRACAGDPVRLTSAELLTVVERLRSGGLTWTQMGKRLGRDGESLGRRVRELTAVTTSAAQTADSPEPEAVAA